MSEWVAIGLQAIGLASDAISAADQRRAYKTEYDEETRATQESRRRINLERADFLGQQQTTAAAAGVDVKASQSFLELRREALREYTARSVLERDIGASKAAGAGLRGKAAGYQELGAWASLANFGVGVYESTREKPPKTTTETGD